MEKKEKVVGIIYETTNRVNGRRYIGKHLVGPDYDGSFDGYLGSGTLLKKAISYYGDSNFERVTLKECFSVEELEESEEYYLRLFDCANNPGYYNVINTCYLGGRCSGYHHTEETKAKIGERSGATRKGMKLSESHKSNISKSLNTEENRKRQSETMSGRIKVNNGEVERSISPEELDGYLSQGYQLGRLPQNRITNPELSQYWKGKYQSSETVEKRMESIRGTIAVSKEGITKKIQPSELEIYLSDGWVRGMTDSFKEDRSNKVKGKIHIYLGEDQKFLTPEEAEPYLAEGWQRGLPPSQRKKLSEASKLREQKKRENAMSKRDTHVKEE